MTINELLLLGRTKLELSSPSPALDAELLMIFVLKSNRLELIKNRQHQTLSYNEQAEFLALIERRASHEPIAYLTGQKEFYALDFKVTSDVLIPRPETELLVELALSFLAGRSGPVRILDLGTGSGCIAVSIAYALKQKSRDFKFVAVDKSCAALAIASENASRYELTHQIEFIESNWYSAIKPQSFDLILSNPPYIAEHDTNCSAEIKFEPQTALYAGASGMDDIDQILAGLKSHLNPSGLALIEIGSDQGLKAIELANSYGFKVELHSDLARLDRVLRVENS